MTKYGPWQSLPRSPVVNREQFILEESRGKRVLELGCANWPFTIEFINQGELLYQRLEKVCASLAGIDISAEGITLLKSRGFKNVFTADASKFEEITTSLGWTPEIIIAGEILEHVGTPEQTLRELASSMPSECTLLITVPNAFSIKSFIHVILGHEKQHTDHVACYSYNTMRQLLLRANLEVIYMRYFKIRPGNLIEKALDYLFIPIVLFRPYFSDGLIFCCRRLN